MAKYSNEQIISETCRVLDGVNWVDRYKRLAKTICSNKEVYEKISRQFQVKCPLNTFTSAHRPKQNKVDLRFAGMSVAEVMVNDNGEVTMSVSENQAKKANNLDYKKIKGKECKSFTNKKWTTWKDDDKNRSKKKLESEEYRSFFNGLKSTKTIKEKVKGCKEERRIEQWILDEMQNRRHHLLQNIRPIRYCGHFFQMPTPFLASDHGTLPQYSPKGYGGIDILATIGNRYSHLVVIELKDQNKKDEPQYAVLQQALIYATFLAKLLKSEAGEEWWSKIIRDEDKKDNNKKVTIPEKLEIYAVTLMPDDGKTEEWTSNKPYSVDGLDNVYIYPRKLYYTPDNKNDENKGNPCKFWGTFTEVLPK